ncbi:hypothetical protein JMUB6875_66680 [Nocardia sp. JMUB6875]|uniref:sialidase family protein n=1 Tax=Nocardia sp. JMUB6875 TaxID=3158170 RepID=UPI0032E6B8F2
MGLRNPVVLAGVVGVGAPVLAAGVVAALTLDPGGNGLDAGADHSTRSASASPTPPSPTPAPPGNLVADVDPVGFQPDSINFSSEDEGWVLGRTYPCTGEPCRELRHTTDGGRTWQPEPFPALLRTAAHEDGWIEFADARNGWIRAGALLFSTHDGGTTWHQVDLDVNAVTDGWTISFSEDSAYIAATQPGEKVVLFTSPLASDSWSETTDIPAVMGDGPDPSAEVSVVGNRAWLVVTDRTKTGARLVNGVWSPWQLPCGGNGPADWHALTERRVVALCGRSGPGIDDTATTHLMTSLDGGISFTETGQLSPTLPGSANLFPADALHLVAAVDAHLLTSTDGGETWTTAYTAPGTDWVARSGDFVSATTGFVIMHRTGTEHSPSLMLTTKDAGRTWTPVSFG